MSEEVRITSSTGAQKGSKLARYDLVPAAPLKHLAELYGRGAAKYAERNWEGGYDWSLSFAALNRHLWQFWSGEDTDDETGAPHLASVAWHAFALLEYMDTHPEFDNRPGKHAEAIAAPVEAPVARVFNVGDPEPADKETITLSGNGRDGNVRLEYGDYGPKPHGVSRWWARRDDPSDNTHAAWDYWLSNYGSLTEVL